MSRPGPGKFEGNESLEVAEKLYEMLNEGSEDESIGDIEEEGFFAALFKHIILDEDTGEILSEDEEGGYIVDEDSNGFFTYKEYDTDEELSEAWEEYISSMEP